MYPDLAAVATGVVFFKLRDVVADIIDQVHVHFLPGAAEDTLEDLARLVHEQLPVAPGEVGCRSHGSDIVLAFLAVDGRRQAS